MARRVSMPAADDLFRPTGDLAEPARAVEARHGRLARLDRSGRRGQLQEHGAEALVGVRGVQRHEGAADHRVFLLHRSQYEIIDTWYAMGMGGTGSRGSAPAAPASVAKQGDK